MLRRVLSTWLLSACTVFAASDSAKNSALLDEAFSYASAGDYRRAKAIWQGLAESGEPAAQYNLCLIHEKAISVAADLELSMDYCLQSASQDYPPAMAHLGTKYYLGIGVARDFGKARDWYDKAAQLGDPGAQASLGDIYASIEGGENFARAHEYWMMAAVQGNVQSMFNLGVSYHHGIGTAPNIDLAIELYTAAAAGNSLEAMANLVGIYAEGKEVPQDLARAYFWCDISVAAGLEGNREYLAWLRTQLSAEELTSLKDEITNWHQMRRADYQ